VVVKDLEGFAGLRRLGRIQPHILWREGYVDEYDLTERERSRVGPRTPIRGTDRVVERVVR
jgi:hypothetical protein